MELDLQRRQMLAETLEAIGNHKRLATFEQLSRGVAAKDIHKHIDASRSGVQRFLTDFKESGLATAEEGQYALTGKGQVVAEALADLDDRFEEFEREQFRELAEQSSLSVDEMEEMLREVKEGE